MCPDGYLLYESATDRHQWQSQPEVAALTRVCFFSQDSVGTPSSW